MARFAELAALCRALAGTPGRLEKRRLAAEYLAGLPLDDVPNAVAFLIGRPFPASDPRALHVSTSRYQGTSILRRGLTLPRSGAGSVVV
jgi:hypothetical protein